MCIFFLKTFSSLPSLANAGLSAKKPTAPSLKKRVSERVGKDMQCQPCEPDEAQQQRRSEAACGDCDAGARRTCARCRVRIFQSGVGGGVGNGLFNISGGNGVANTGTEPEREPEATGALPELEREFSKLMSNGVYAEFDAHAQAVQTALEKRRERLQFASNTMEELVEDAMADAEDVDAGLGVWREGDAYQGDVNLRTLNALLERVDQRGFERHAPPNQTPARRPVHPLDSLGRRSPHQLEFHAAFFEACSRIIFKDDWEVSKPQICRKYGWEEVKSEVMISCASRPLSTTRTLPHPSPPPPQDAAALWEDLQHRMSLP